MLASSEHDAQFRDIIGTFLTEWLTRHVSLANKFVYTPAVKNALRAELAENPQAAITLSEQYRMAGTTVARQQVILAGHRIAALLQDPQR